MAEPQRAHQILPVRTIPDGIDVTKPGEMARWLRLIYQDVGQAFQRQQADLNNDPRLKDDRIATGVRGMGNAIRYVDNPASLAGAVATLISRYEWTFADFAAPGPGGVTPSVGIPDGDKGDITVSGSGTVWNIDANAVGTTEIADSAVTAAKIANRTRRDFLPLSRFVQVNGTGMSFSTFGTYPDNGEGAQFIDAPAVGPQGIMAIWRVPKDWDSGTVSAIMLFKLIAAGAGLNTFFTFRLRTLAYSVGSSPTGAATDVVNDFVNTNNYTVSQERNLGAITVSADQLVRIVIDRDSTGTDDSTDTLNFMGLSLEYTADS